MSQAGPGASGRAWPQSPALPVLSLPPLLRQPSLRGLLPWPRASQPTPTLCLALWGSQLPPGHRLPKNIPGPLELIIAYTVLHAIVPGPHAYNTPCCAPTAPPPPSTHTRNLGVTSDLSCSTGTASAKSPSRSVISSPRSLMPLSDFPASTLMGTQAPHPTCLLLMGPASVLHPLSLSPQSLHSQDPPLASYSLMGHPAPHSARVPREPSVSPGMTFSCPHVQPCGLGSLLPPGSFSLLCLCYPSAWHPAPG